MAKNEGDKPLVSVITPSFNQGEFIEDTLQSVMKQDYPNIEHLVLDGGSSDNTITMLKQYETKYCLRWLSEADEGQSDAINKGFRMAKGEIVYWLNSDDVIFDTRVVYYIVEQFQRHKQADVIYGDGVFIDRSSQVLRVVRVPSWDYARLRRSCFIVQPAVFFRSPVVKRNALNKNLHFSMDYEFWLRLGRKYRFAKVDRILTGFRVYEQAKSSANKDKLRLEDRHIQLRYGQEFGPTYHVHYLGDRLLFGYLSLKGIKSIMGLDEAHDLAFEAEIPNRLSRIKTQLPLKEMLRSLVLRT
jgi:glycosyltransferase involved in cell wall biosynthesis